LTADRAWSRLLKTPITVERWVPVIAVPPVSAGRLTSARARPALAAGPP
jgi:hypothetical protein